MVRRLKAGDYNGKWWKAVNGGYGWNFHSKIMSECYITV